MFTLKTHERSPDGLRITKVRHYVRLSHDKNPPLFIQDGNVYGEGGDLVKDIPEWFYRELDKVSDKQLAVVNFSRPKKSAEKADPTGDESSQRKRIERRLHNQ